MINHTTDFWSFIYIFFKVEAVDQNWIQWKKIIFQNDPSFKISKHFLLITGINYILFRFKKPDHRRNGTKILHQAAQPPAALEKKNLFKIIIFIIIEVHLEKYFKHILNTFDFCIKVLLYVNLFFFRWVAGIPYLI